MKSRLTGHMVTPSLFLDSPPTGPAFWARAQFGILLQPRLTLALLFSPPHTILVLGFVAGNSVVVRIACLASVPAHAMVCALINFADCTDKLRTTVVKLPRFAGWRDAPMKGRVRREGLEGGCHVIAFHVCEKRWMHRVW
jgi:hypothetical protein